MKALNSNSRNAVAMCAVGALALVFGAASLVLLGLTEVAATRRRNRRQRPSRIVCPGAFVVGLSTICLAAATVAAPVYSVLDLGTLGGSFGYPLGINNSGQVVGYARTTGNVAYRATLFGLSGAPSNTDLGTLGGATSFAYGINSSGQVVGLADMAGSAANHATLFGSSGTPSNIDLGTLGGPYSTALGINDNGQVVGFASTTGGGNHATLFGSSGTLSNIDLGSLGGSYSIARSINNSGQVVGYATTTGDADLHATVFGASGTPSNIDLGTLGGRDSYAVGINNSGQVVGYASTTGNIALHATLYGSSGTPSNIDLGTLGGSVSIADGINNNSQIVGYSTLADGSADAFLWAGGVMMSIDSLVDPSAGWNLFEAIAINDLGQIAAYGIDPTGSGHALLLSLVEPAIGNVPEPGSLALLGAALLGLAATRRKQGGSRRMADLLLLQGLFCREGS